jgi:hypothetical protein
MSDPKSSAKITPQQAIGWVLAAMVIELFAMAFGEMLMPNVGRLYQAIAGLIGILAAGAVGVVIAYLGKQIVQILKR